MVVVTAEAYKNARVRTLTIKNKEVFWVKMKDAQDGLGVKNICDLLRKEICGIYESKDLTEKQKKKYIRSAYKITKESTDDHKMKYARSDIMERIIKNCRGVKKWNDSLNRTERRNQREDFRIVSGFQENCVYESKETSVLKSIMDTFEGENMEIQYHVLNYRIDLYFHDYKLAVEIDENGHKDRNKEHESQRQKEIETKLGCTFIRINPDKENFNIFKAQNKIFRYIKKSDKESTKKIFN